MIHQKFIAQLLITIYRVISVVIVFSPLVINLFFKTELVVSLLYIPLLSLLLAIFAIIFDRKLQNCLRLPLFTKQRRLAKGGVLASNRYRLSE